MRVSIFGGNSLATTSLVRLSMKGVMRLRNWSIFSLLPWRSMGLRNSTPKRFWLPRKPGIKKWKRLHSSPRWFSMGVPDKHRR